jgi:adenosylhomocysteine nucleosidase
MSRVAIVAALEREVRPLVKSWSVAEKEHAGRRFRFFEKDEFVLVCGGIGAEAARRAAEAVIALYTPALVYSAGFAGGLDPALRIADVLQPRFVINAGDGSRVQLDHGDGVLVSVAAVASVEQKAKLRESYAAQAVDMEAAAVARAAEARGIRFAIVKAISDEFDFTFPEMARFVNSEGRFMESRFGLYAGLRPWLWAKVIRLARDSGRASRALCGWLQNMDTKQNSISADVEALETVHRP